MKASSYRSLYWSDLLETRDHKLDDKRQTELLPITQLIGFVGNDGVLIAKSVVGISGY